MTRYVSRRILDIIEEERARGGDIRGDYRLADGEPAGPHSNGGASSARERAEATLAWYDEMRPGLKSGHTDRLSSALRALLTELDPP